MYRAKHMHLGVLWVLAFLCGWCVGEKCKCVREDFTGRECKPFVSGFGRALDIELPRLDANQCTKNQFEGMYWSVDGDCKTVRGFSDNQCKSKVVEDKADDCMIWREDVYSGVSKKWKCTKIPEPPAQLDVCRCYMLGYQDEKCAGTPVGTVSTYTRTILPVMDTSECLQDPSQFNSIFWQVTPKCKGAVQYLDSDCTPGFELKFSGSPSPSKPLFNGTCFVWHEGKEGSAKRTWAKFVCDNLGSTRPAPAANVCKCQKTFYKADDCSGAGAAAGKATLFEKDIQCQRAFNSTGYSAGQTYDYFQASTDCKTLTKFPSKACFGGEKADVTVDTCVKYTNLPGYTAFKISCTSAPAPAPTVIPKKPEYICNCDQEMTFAQAGCTGQNTTRTPQPFSDRSIVPIPLKCYKARGGTWLSFSKDCTSLLSYDVDFQTDFCREDTLLANVTVGACAGRSKLRCTKQRVQYSSNGQPPCPLNPPTGGTFSYPQFCNNSQVGDTCPFQCTSYFFPYPQGKIECVPSTDPTQPFSVWDTSSASCGKEAPKTPPAPDDAERCHCFIVDLGNLRCEGTKNSTTGRSGYGVANPVAHPGVCVQKTNTRFIRYGARNGKCATVSEYSTADCESSSHFNSEDVDGRCNFGRKLQCVTYPPKPTPPTGKSCYCKLEAYMNADCSGNVTTFNFTNIPTNAELCVDTLSADEYTARSHYKINSGCSKMDQYPSSACASWEEKSINVGSCTKMEDSTFPINRPVFVRGNPTPRKSFKVTCEEKDDPPPPVATDLCECLLIKYSDENCTRKASSNSWKLIPGFCKPGWSNYLNIPQYSGLVEGTPGDKCGRFRVFDLDSNDACNARGMELDLMNKKTCSKMGWRGYYKVECTDKPIRKTASGSMGCLEPPSVKIAGGELSEDCANKLPGETCAFECHFGFSLSGDITCREKNGKVEWLSTATCRAEEFCKCEFTESLGHMCTSPGKTDITLWPSECTPVKFKQSALTKNLKIQSDCKGVLEWPQDDTQCSYGFSSNRVKLLDDKCMNDETSSVKFNCKIEKADCKQNPGRSDCDPSRCRCYWINDCDNGENKTTTVRFEIWPIMKPGGCYGPPGRANIKWSVNAGCRNFAAYIPSKDCSEDYDNSRRTSLCSGPRQLSCEKLPAQPPKIEQQCKCTTSFYSSSTCQGQPMNATWPWQDLYVNDEYCFRGPRGTGPWGTSRYFHASKDCNTLTSYDTPACAYWESQKHKNNECFAVDNVGVKISCAASPYTPPAPKKFPPADKFDVCACKEELFDNDQCSGTPVEATFNSIPTEMCFTNSRPDKTGIQTNRFDTKTQYFWADSECKNVKYYFSYWTFPEPHCKEDTLYNDAKVGECKPVPGDTKIWSKITCTKKPITLQVDGATPCASEPVVEGGGNELSSCFGLAVGEICPFTCPEGTLPADNEKTLKCEASDNEFWGRWSSIDCSPIDYCTCSFYQSLQGSDCGNHQSWRDRTNDINPGKCTAVSSSLSLTIDKNCEVVTQYANGKCVGDKKEMKTDECFVDGKGHILTSCRKRSRKNADDCVDLMKKCDGKCIDVMEDDNNCGSCGYACDSGLKCGGGKCRQQCICQLEIFTASSDTCEGDPNTVADPTDFHHGACLNLPGFYDKSVFAYEECSQIKMFNHFNCVPPAAIAVKNMECFKERFGGGRRWNCVKRGLSPNIRSSKCVMPTFSQCNISFSASACDMMPLWATCLKARGCINQLSAACYGIFHKFANSCNNNIPSECDSDEVVKDRDICSSFEYGQCAKEMFNQKPDADDCWILESDVICAKKQKCADILADTCHTGGPFDTGCNLEFKKNCS